MTFGMEKATMVWLPDGEKNLKIRLLVLTESTNVTDGQTDTACRRLRIASRCKKLVTIGSYGFYHAMRMHSADYAVA